MAKGERWVIIDGKRYNLSSMTVIWEGHKEVGTGIFRKEIFLMPRAKRVIVHTYSIWENRRTHGCVGDIYYIANDEQVARLADDTRDSRLMELVPEGEA